MKVRFNKLSMGSRPQYNGTPGQVLEVPDEYGRALIEDNAATQVGAKTFQKEMNANVETAEASKSRVERRQKPES